MAKPVTSARLELGACSGPTELVTTHGARWAVCEAPDGRGLVIRLLEGSILVRPDCSNVVLLEADGMLPNEEGDEDIGTTRCWITCDNCGHVHTVPAPHCTECGYTEGT